MTEFDPRQAALYHAAHVEGENSGEHALSEAVTALACGMIYIGDQVRAAAEGPAASQLVLPRELVAALRRIRDHAEGFGSGPVDDEMREIARRALEVCHGGTGE